MLGDNPSLGELARLRAVTELIQTRMAHLTEATDLVGPFYVADDAVEVADDARAQLKDDAGAVLDAAVTALEAVPDEHSGVLGSDASFTAAAIEAALREALVDGLGIKPKFAFGPLRTAVSGRRVSPPLFESMEILGKTADADPAARAARDALSGRSTDGVGIARFGCGGGRPVASSLGSPDVQPASRNGPTAYPMGYGVIGNTGDSGSSVLGSSPGTPALVLGLAAGGDSEKFPPFGKVLLRCPPPPSGQATVTAPLCSGLARRPLKAVARVRIPSGLHQSRRPGPPGPGLRRRPGDRMRVRGRAQARWALTASWATRRRATQHRVDHHRADDDRVHRLLRASLGAQRHVEVDRRPRRASPRRSGAADPGAGATPAARAAPHRGRQRAHGRRVGRRPCQPRSRHERRPLVAHRSVGPGVGMRAGRHAEQVVPRRRRAASASRMARTPAMPTPPVLDEGAHEADPLDVLARRTPRGSGSSARPA